MRPTLLAGLGLTAALALPNASGAQLLDALGALKMAPGSTPVIHIDPTLGLAPITAAELLAAGGGIDDLGAVNGVVDASFSSAFDPTGGAASVGSVARTVDPVWWSWMSQKQFNQIDVQYDLVSAAGNADELSSVDDPTSFMAVTLDPIAPQIVDSDQNQRLVHGSLNLTLDLDAVRATGPHTGTLTVTVNNL